MNLVHWQKEKTIENIYKLATDEPYGFLYVKLAAKNINEMFHSSLKKTFILTNEK